jgi:hypothetical protein
MGPAPVVGQYFSMADQTTGRGLSFQWNGKLWENMDATDLPSSSGGGGGGGSDPAQIGLGYAQLGLETELGRGELDVSRKRLGLDTEIDRGRLGVERQSQAELMRSNKAREAEDRKQRALDAASSALTSYLRGTELADARRLSAAQEARALLPSLVNPNQKYFGGQGPNEALSQASARFGLPFQGSEIVHKQMTPQVLAGAPTPALIGSEIVKHVKGVKKAGNKK